MPKDVLPQINGRLALPAIPIPVSRVLASLVGEWVANPESWCQITLAAAESRSGVAIANLLPTGRLP